MDELDMRTNERDLCHIIAQYRQLAAEAQRAALTAVPSDFREAYRTMARHWVDLADELESRFGSKETVH